MWSRRRAATVGFTSPGPGIRISMDPGAVDVSSRGVQLASLWSRSVVSLGDFIHSHHEAVLVEWESFARTLLPGAEGMTASALRDHADLMLTVLVQDMESHQSVSEGVTKSKGSKESGRLGELGQLHAVIRLEHGFTLPQMLAEYRALRASVLRLWGEGREADPEGVLRFNEAIDEALSEAVTAYTDATEEYRSQVVGIVGHDLRNPLAAVLAGSSVLLDSEALDDKSVKVAAKVQNSARRMARIVSDLLDLTHARLGTEIPVVRRPMDLGSTCEAAVAELEASRPDTVIRYTGKGDLRGEWDSDRITQVVSNLVANALQHGDTHQPINVDAKDAGDEVVVTVHNEGPPIPENVLPHIFEPLARHTRDNSKPTPGSFGLGLFIVKQLVMSHGGQVNATSTRVGGTTFTVRLPRLPKEKPGLSPEVTEGAASDANEARPRSPAAYPIRRGRRTAAPR